MALNLSLTSGLLLVLCTCLAHGQGFGGGSKGPDKAPASKADLPLIRCQVCEAVVKQAISEVKGMRAELKPGKRVSGWALQGPVQVPRLVARVPMQMIWEGSDLKFALGHAPHLDLPWWLCITADRAASIQPRSIRAYISHWQPCSCSYSAGKHCTHSFVQLTVLEASHASHLSSSVFLS